MSRRFLLAACLLSLSVLLPAQGPSVSGPELTGRLEPSGDREVLTLWGAPEQRGFAHGHLMAERIVAALDEDLSGFIRRFGLSAARFKGQILQRVVPAFRWSDDELAELRGMLAGIRSRLRPEERRSEFLGREIELVDLQAINTAGDWMSLGCSTVAVSGKLTADGKPAVARNFDFPGLKLLLDGQVVLRSQATEDAKGWIGVTHPGCIGLMTGMNDEGVFVSIHDVPVRPGLMNLLRPNVPRLTALRRLLEGLAAAGAVTRAHEMLQGWTTLYGNNFMVVTPVPDAAGRFAGVVEYDGREHLEDGATLRTLDSRKGDVDPWITCTNHHRQRGVDEAASFGCKRYRRLSGWLEARENPAPLDTAALFTLARQASVPRRPRPQQLYGFGTLHQVVAFTGSRTLHVKLGRVGRHLSEVKAQIFDVDDLVAETTTTATGR